MVKKKVTKKEDNSGLFIPAGLFLGLGIGGLFGDWGAGILVGLGIGFLGMAIARMSEKNNFFS
ncbi:MAG: hypothetical protein ABIF88_02800 [archaeon]